MSTLFSNQEQFDIFAKTIAESLHSRSKGKISPKANLVKTCIVDAIKAIDPSKSADFNINTLSAEFKSKKQENLQVIEEAMGLPLIIRSFEIAVNNMLWDNRSLVVEAIKNSFKPSFITHKPVNEEIRKLIPFLKLVGDEVREGRNLPLYLNQLGLNDSPSYKNHLQAVLEEIGGFSVSENYANHLKAAKLTALINFFDQCLTDWFNLLGDQLSLSISKDCREDERLANLACVAAFEDLPDIKKERDVVLSLTEHLSITLKTFFDFSGF